MAERARPVAGGLGRIGIVTLVALAIVPLVATAAGEPFYITLFSRIVVFAIAAVGLNLALGYGGMISFGHSLYIGIGAYAAGVLTHHGVTAALIQLPIALIVGAVVAVLVGLVCLRTGGIAFIMITLAFAQMMYFVVIGIKQYGGDDGLPIPARSSVPGLDLESPMVFYYVAFAVLAIVLFAMSRLVRSRFGWVVQGCRSNERRMAALGFPVLRYKLAAYVLSALVCVVAGFLLANLARFASPSYLQWLVSGELIVMVVLGGIGSLIGPVLGAIVLLVLEELLSNFGLPLPGSGAELVRTHWMGLIGIFVIVTTLVSRRGVMGLLRRFGGPR